MERDPVLLRRIIEEFAAQCALVAAELVGGQLAPEIGAIRGQRQRLRIGIARLLQEPPSILEAGESDPEIDVAGTAQQHFGEGRCFLPALFDLAARIDRGGGLRREAGTSRKENEEERTLRPKTEPTGDGPPHAGAGATRGWPA